MLLLTDLNTSCDEKKVGCDSKTVLRCVGNGPSSERSLSRLGESRVIKSILGTLDLTFQAEV